MQIYSEGPGWKAQPEYDCFGEPLLLHGQTVPCDAWWETMAQAVDGNPGALRQLALEMTRKQAEHALLGRPFEEFPLFLHVCTLYGAEFHHPTWEVMKAEHLFPRACNPLNGFNPAHGLALANSDPALFAELDGVNLNAPCDGGWTPLLHAAVKGDGLSMGGLLDADADPNLQEPESRMTAAHIVAAKPDFEFAPQTIYALCHKGAKLTIRDRRGRTPLECAEEAGHTDVVEAIRSILGSA